MDDVYEIADESPVFEESKQYAPLASKQKEELKDQTPELIHSEVSPNFISTSAANGINDDEMHKFIRTAQMKFKVKDVVEATQLIENIVLNNKGFILNSSIVNKQLSPHTINISKDSSLVTYYLNLESKLQLKVPSQFLDTTLRQIAPLAVSIDYRTVNADDVTTRLMSEKMAQTRMAKKQKRLSSAIDNKGQKLSDITNAEEALDNAMEQEDNAKIFEFITNEQIAYSTISIDIYQDIKEIKNIVTRIERFQEYESGIAVRIMNGLANGWFILVAVFVFLINIWPVVLIVFVIAIIYLRMKKKRNKGIMIS
ncbi:MAG: DUF4349 domain-containing protein [Dysgonomonas sp.]